jgi:hypothetical protein
MKKEVRKVTVTFCHKTSHSKMRAFLERNVTLCTIPPLRGDFGNILNVLQWKLVKFGDETDVERSRICHSKSRK